MRHSAPYHLLKTILLTLTGFFFSLVLAVLLFPAPEIEASLPAVSVLPVPIVLAVVETLPTFVAPVVAVPEIVPVTVKAPKPIVRAPVVAVPEIIPIAIEAPKPIVLAPAPVIAIPKIAPVTVEAPRLTVPSLALAVIPAKPIVKKAQARLYIPSIGVDAIIRETGYTATGAMAVPNSRFDVGWFAPGTRPGETGSAVIAGHNDWTGGAGVFERLDRLVPGDVLSIVDAHGVTTTYVVVGTRTFAADDENSGIFESASGAHLNLITCSGVFDPATGTYTTRHVVFTDLVVTS